MFIYVSWPLNLCNFVVDNLGVLMLQDENGTQIRVVCDFWDPGSLYVCLQTWKNGLKCGKEYDWPRKFAWSPFWGTLCLIWIKTCVAWSKMLQFQTENPWYQNPRTLGQFMISCLYYVCINWNVCLLICRDFDFLKHMGAHLQRHKHVAYVGIRIEMVLSPEPPVSGAYSRSLHTTSSVCHFQRGRHCTCARLAHRFGVLARNNQLQ